MNIKGIEVHYYAICHPKLWLFHRGIGFENEFDRVQEGHILHQRAYSKLEKELEIDDVAVVDAVDDEYIREVKISSKMKKADRLQMLYYLYLLHQKGIKKKGLLSYPREKQTEEVILEDDSIRRLKNVLQEIPSILNGPIPPFKKLPYCGKCAYRDFCFSGEVELDEP